MRGGGLGRALVIAAGAIGVGLAGIGHNDRLIGKVAGMMRSGQRLDLFVVGQQILCRHQRFARLALHVGCSGAHAGLVAGIDLAAGFGNRGFGAGFFAGMRGGGQQPSRKHGNQAQRGRSFENTGHGKALQQAEKTPERPHPWPC